MPDDLRDGDVEYTIILSPAVSRDAKYHGMDPDDIAITNVGGVTLKDLVLSTGPLSPSFAGATWEYASATGNGTNAVTVTATVSNPDVAALTINGAAARSGAASDPIALAVGQNAILVAVTNARVGLTTTYVVDLTRRENNAPSGLALADQTAMAGTAFHYAFAEVHDPDPDQTITYTAAMDGGGALPGWLRFEPETRAFSGTPQGADAGAAVIAVTAADDGVPSKAALATFTLTVSAPDVNAHALRLGLAAFGRTVASNAVDAIDSRFSDAEARGTTLGGRAVTTNGNGGKAAGLLWGLAHSAGLTVNLPRADALEALPGHDPRPDAPVRFQRRALDDALSQSAFLLKPGAGEGDSPSPWAFWGRGAAAGFSSAEDGMALDGRVFSAFIGLDRRLKNDVTLGVAYARSTGQIDYTGAGGDQGEMDVTLNSVAPYVRWAAGSGMSAWGMGGAGWGTAKVADRYHDARTDISMIMGALGARHPVASLGRVALALKGDAFALGIGSDARVNVAATEADAQRLRFALEGSADHALSAAAVLSPRLEIGGRWDRGSAETGLGAEVGGGVDLRHDPSGWGLETRGRYLLTHQSAGFDDWGASVSLRFDPGSRDRGFRMALSPTWGQPDSRAEALWDATQTLSAGDDRASTGSGLQPQAFDLEIGHAAPVGAGLLTSYSGLTAAGGETRLRLGGRLEVGNALRFNLEGERSRHAHGEQPATTLRLRGRLVW